ncbi:HD family phosphohydrolase [Calothrix sp. PCC 6303]|uniref:HD family phosphohydrolase n=1 Tax=Calothrix sp. PCC 6303 TaxID=1170562 RepID=UPI0002A02168|nr:HDIG domain-containing metalloprotein [Calothrix sp. PCC 6303]AFZ02698.1 7TM receptor with intracellular metal dependent phosphohydrolase [Calothrix sp. PCC 6303]
MKQVPFFESLTQKLKYWQRICKLRCRKFVLHAQAVWKSRNKVLQSGIKLVKTSTQIKSFDISRIVQRSSAIAIIAILSLTSVMGHKLYNQPQLLVGSIAPQTFYAAKTLTIENKQETQQRRDIASQDLVPVLMIDVMVNQRIEQNLHQLLEQGDKVRDVAGEFPFFDTLLLSYPTQRYLRSTSESEWQLFVTTINNLQQKQKTSKTKLPLVIGKDLQSIPRNANLEFATAVNEIQSYRQTTAESNFSALISHISRIRNGYIEARVKLKELIELNPNIPYTDTSILNLSSDNWNETKLGIQHCMERILAQGLPPGLPDNILQDAVNLHLRSLVPPESQALASKILTSVLQPNLKNDAAKTQIRAQQIVDRVTPVMVVLEAGDIIVNQGEKINYLDYQALEAYHLIQRKANWWGLLALSLLITTAIGIYAVVERQNKAKFRQRDRLLILLLGISTPLVLLITPYTSWSAVGLLLGSFYGATISTTVIGLLVVLLSVSMEISRIALISGAAGALLGGVIAHRMRSREELALLGIGIALTEGGLYLLLKLFLGRIFVPNWYLVFQESLLFAVSGLIWTIVALGLSSYLEQLFDIVTPIRLAELANPNRTLLKQLASKTPGTFQHTLFVASLAEAAARKLGCNIELIRAGTLYHDIGKMHDPEAFIENQMGRPNKHDTKIKDPWKSAAIIKKHVTEGLVMAKKHRLPSAIQAFIPEHQGTMQIAYFYHQAQQLAKENPEITVDIADFSYDGPIPRSRETAIVMLADSCEAALRSLKDTTPEQALNMLNNILRARWQERQLVDSGLTRAEMTEMAEIFVEVWQQFHHKRIAYPKTKVSNDL